MIFHVFGATFFLVLNKKLKAEGLHEENTKKINNIFDFLSGFGGDINFNNVDIFVGITTCELRQNQYEELSSPKIFGIKQGNTLINSRPHAWNISKSFECQSESFPIQLPKNSKALKG